MKEWQTFVFVLFVCLSDCLSASTPTVTVHHHHHSDDGCCVTSVHNNIPIRPRTNGLRRVRLLPVLRTRSLFSGVSIMYIFNSHLLMKIGCMRHVLLTSFSFSVSRSHFLCQRIFWNGICGRFNQNGLIFILYSYNIYIYIYIWSSITFCCCISTALTHTLQPSIDRLID